MKKNLMFLAMLLFSFNFVSAFNYYDISPSEILENEWVVFAGVFLLVFALVYMSLVNFFSRKKRKYYWEPEEKVLENKAPIAVIALVIAFFTAATFVQQGFLYGVFGEAIAGWVFLIVLIVIIILTLPFYKALKKNIGTGPAVFILVGGIWAIVKFLLNPYEFDFYNFNVSDWYFQFYDTFTHPATIIILLVVLGLFMLIKGASRSRR